MSNYHHEIEELDQEDKEWDETIMRVMRESEESGISFDHLMGMELAGLNDDCY
jgi:hypothetical protein